MIKEKDKEKAIGQKFNELTIEKFIDKPKDTDKYKSWNTNIWVTAKCSCGKTISAPWYGIRKGLIKSCGHLISEKSSETLKKYRIIPNERYITYENKTHNISQWSEITGIPVNTISYRLAQGLPLKKVFRKKAIHGKKKQDQSS